MGCILDETVKRIGKLKMLPGVFFMILYSGRIYAKNLPIAGDKKDKDVVRQNGCNLLMQWMSNDAFYMW